MHKQRCNDKSRCSRPKHNGQCNSQCRKQNPHAVITVKIKNYVEDLKTKSAAELQEELVAAKKELFNLRFQNATNQLDNTSRIKEVRKNIARIQTLIAQNKAKAAE